MRMRRPQQLAIGHSRQKNIVRKTRLPRNFRARIHAPPWHTNHAQLFFFIHVRPRFARSLLRRPQKSADTRCTGTNSQTTLRESRPAKDSASDPTMLLLLPKLPACNTRTAPPPNPQTHPAKDAAFRPLQVLPPSKQFSCRTPAPAKDTKAPACPPLEPRKPRIRPAHSHVSFRCAPNPREALRVKSCTAQTKRPSPRHSASSECAPSSE